MSLALRAARRRLAEETARQMQAAWAGANLDHDTLERQVQRLLHGDSPQGRRLEDMMRDAAQRVPKITWAEALERMH